MITFCSLFTLSKLLLSRGLFWCEDHFSARRSSLWCNIVDVTTQEVILNFFWIQSCYLFCPAKFYIKTCTTGSLLLFLFDFRKKKKHYIFFYFKCFITLRATCFFTGGCLWWPLCKQALCKTDWEATFSVTT